MSVVAVLVVFALLAQVLAAFAGQAPPLEWRTLPNGQRVPCTHPLAVVAGLGCDAIPAPPAPAAPVPTADDPNDPAPDCVGVNPYTEPERAEACLLWGLRNRKPAPGPCIYQVDGRYRQPYAPLDRMRVIGMARNTGGRVVVTGEYFAPAARAGELVAFVCTPGGSSWVPEWP